MPDNLECQHFSLARSCLVCELEAELAEARRDSERLDWYFGPELKGGEFINAYMTGIREGWTPDQWRTAIDAARAGGGK
jgi:hypothetical protein